MKRCKAILSLLITASLLIGISSPGLFSVRSKGVDSSTDEPQIAEET